MEGLLADHDLFEGPVPSQNREDGASSVVLPSGFPSGYDFFAPADGMMLSHELEGSHLNAQERRHLLELFYLADHFGRTSAPFLAQGIHTMSKSAVPQEVAMSLSLLLDHAETHFLYSSRLRSLALHLLGNRLFFISLFSDIQLVDRAQGLIGSLQAQSQSASTGWSTADGPVPVWA
jgi:hypothetical protein